MLRRLVDRAIAGIAFLVSRAAFRSVEVRGFGDVPRHRPVLVVANHFNGFVDPVLVVSSLGRLPRFLAKATLWKVLPARPFLWLAGILPVYRPEDGGDVAGNESSFARADRALLQKGVVAIFPEGTTHDAPHLVKVRTGAARIALSAYAAGARDLVIVPVGLTFDDKIALRSRAFVEAGPPLDLDAEIGRFVDAGAPADDSNHEAVHRLTEEIALRLRDVSPDFASLREEGALRQAAEVSLRSGLERPQDVVAMGERDDLARELAAAPAPERERISDELARYWLGLSLVGVSDDQLVPRAEIRTIVWRFVRLAILFVLLFPLAVAGVLMNALPAAIVMAAGAAVVEPVTKGTVRFLVGVIVFPLTWILIATFDVEGGLFAGILAAISFPLSPVTELVFDGRGGFGPGLLVFVAAPLFGFAAVYLTEQLQILHRVGRGWYVVTARRAHVREVLVDRTALVADVAAVTGAPAAPVTMGNAAVEGR
jgi:glycerol-3-phosphate O-acyltransferase / dihydroxyacetone phosphate acyltransferase